MGSTRVSSTESTGRQSEISVHDSSREDQITGARYNDDICILKVGLSEHTFWVHKNILSLSCVLECMADASSSAGRKNEITLPDDDADSFGRIIEHLYGNNNAAFEINLLDLEGAEKLADMYVLAEQYQLRDFQDRVIRKLKQMDVLREDRMTFFHTASKICENTRESDNIFEPYFAEQAATHLKSMSKTEAQKLSEMMLWGGRFAKKIFQFQANICREMHLERVMDKVKWKADVAAVQEQLQSATAKSTADLAKASRMHKSQHPACGYCHILL